MSPDNNNQGPNNNAMPDVKNMPRRIKLLPVRNGVLFPGIKTTIKTSTPELAELLRQGKYLIVVHVFKDELKLQKSGQGSFNKMALPEIGSLALLEKTTGDAEESVLLLTVISRVKIDREQIGLYKTPTISITECNWVYLLDQKPTKHIWSQPNFQKSLADLKKSAPLLFDRMTTILQTYYSALKEGVTDDVQAKKGERIITQSREALRELRDANQNTLGLALDKIAGSFFDLYTEFGPTINRNTLEVMRDILFSVSVRDRLKKLSIFVTMLYEYLEKRENGDEDDEDPETNDTSDTNNSPKISSSSDKKLLEKRYQEIKSSLSDEVRAEIEQELKRLKGGMHVAEASMVREHVLTLLDLFSLKNTQDNTDITQAKRILDEDHWGLNLPKERILEHLAMRKYAKETSATILCLVGPPGVGKTSIGKSVARALVRKFTRFSLGGLKDEAEIKGHGLTYIQTKPGQIIKRIIRSGSKNPVFMLDEVDKMGHDVRGDPASALLEALDPEQNQEFLDININVPFDLSGVFFILTANSLDPIPRALRDRMEVIELTGYTTLEKKFIAKQYLIPKIRSKTGFPIPRPGNLTPLDLILSNGAIIKLIELYTMEAGVRQLEREIAKIYRVILKKFELEELNTEGEIQVTAQSLHIYSGKPKIYPEQYFNSMPPGCVPMFAVSENGGHFFYIETRMERDRDHRKIKVTGVRGSGESRTMINNLIEESVDVALDGLILEGGILSQSPEEIGGRKEFYIHVHVRDGATPKDGPSAGIPMRWVLYGLFTKQSIQSNVGATGEIDLVLGAIQPVGGIRDKVLAAYRAGIKKFIIPKENEQDLVDVPTEITQNMEIIPLRWIWETYLIAFPNDSGLQALAQEKIQQGLQ